MTYTELYPKLIQGSMLVSMSIPPIRPRTLDGTTRMLVVITTLDSKDLQVKKDVKEVRMPMRLVYEDLVKVGRLKGR